MHSNFDMSFDMSTISFHCLACLNCDYVNGEIMLAGFHMIIFLHTICPTSMAGCPIYLESPLYKISSLFSHFYSFQMLFYKKCLSLFFSECSFYCLGRFFASWQLLYMNNIDIQKKLHQKLLCILRLLPSSFVNFISVICICTRISLFY